MYRIILTFFSLLCFISGFSQSVPTSYGEAKKLGDVKYRTLQKTNAPEAVRYVVLKSGSDFGGLLRYENSVYVINKIYDLKGKTVTISEIRLSDVN